MKTLNTVALRRCARGFDPGLDPGTLIGDYEIAELVSRGGFAAVYRALDGRGRTVALKLMHEHLACSTKLLRRFQRESAAVAALDHPNIVGILDAGEGIGGRPYIVMEWLEGRDLRDELRSRGSLSVPEIVDIARQVCDALGAAHRLGIVHRDVKAANVVLERRGNATRARLVDFGIAKLLEPLDGYTTLTTQSRLGTPATMAPEQIAGGEVDARADIYALGLLLFQLAAGRLPFCGSSASELEDQHLHASAPRLDELAPVPASLADVVERCLRKHPWDRFPNTAALAAALASLDSAAEPAARATLHARLAPGSSLGDDELDEIFGRLGELLESAGFTIVLETADMLLARERIVGAGDRAEVLGAARALAGAALTIAVDADLRSGAVEPVLAQQPVEVRAVDACVGGGARDLTAVALE